MNAITSAEADTAPFRVSLGDELTEFSGTTRLFAQVARDLGVVLEPQQRKDWQTLGRAAYIIDQYLDVVRGDVESNIAPLLFSGQAIAGVPEELSRDCREFVERQSETRQLEIREQLERVKIMVERQAAANTPTQVVDIRREEAQLLSDLLSLPCEGRQDAAARQKFNAWLTTFLSVGYLFDSFLDVKEDYSSGASGVKPSFHSRKVLGLAVLKEGLAATRKMPLRILGKSALVALRYEIQDKTPDFSNSDQVI